MDLENNEEVINFIKDKEKIVKPKKMFLKLTRYSRGSSFEISPDCLLILKMLNELIENNVIEKGKKEKE